MCNLGICIIKDMYKELIISIIIIVFIFSLDYITQKYTDKTIGETTTKLENLKEKIASNYEAELDTEKEGNPKQINENEINTNTSTEHEEFKKEINDLYEMWNKFHEKLAFYIEHNELEKVETEFTACKSLIESREYKFATEALDKTIFILGHINDKYTFNLENIF